MMLAASVLFSCKKETVKTGQSTVVVPELRSQPAIDPFGGVDDHQIEAILNGMSLEEKIGQMIVWTPDLSNVDIQQLAPDLIKKGRVGGLLPHQMELGQYLFWMDSLRRTSAIPLLVGTNEKVSLHGQFTDGVTFPKPESIAAIDSSGLKDFLEDSFYKQCSELGIQFSLRGELPMPADSSGYEHPDQFWKNEQIENGLLRSSAEKMLTFADNFSLQYIEPDDSLQIARLYDAYCLMSNGLPGVFLQENIFESEQVKTAPAGFIQYYLSEKMGFRGLALTRLLEGESPEMKLLQGADLFLATDVDYFFLHAFQLFDEGRLTEAAIDKRVRRILRAKAWVHGGQLPVELSVFPRDSTRMAVRLVSFESKQAPKVIRKYQPRAERFEQRAEKTMAYFNSPAWSYFVKDLFGKSVTCASDVNKLLPFKQLLQKDFRIIETPGGQFKQFKTYFSKYADFHLQPQSLTTSGQLAKVQITNPSEQTVAIILLDSVAISGQLDRPFIQSINELSANMDVVLVNFGSPNNLAFFSESITFLQVYERNNWTESYAAQALFGGVAINGKLPVTVSPNLPMGASEYIYQERVSFDGPEGAGIAPERLVGIDAIAMTAIKNRAFPGCQVAVVKNGKVVYSKAFGYHTYENTKKVTSTDLYDIASVSKIASTTLAVMKLEERNKLSISGKIGDYAKLEQDATIRNIRMKDLLIHSSGLQAPMPIGKFYNYRSVPAGGCNDIYCKAKTGDFNVQISPSLFFRSDYRDTIWHRVEQLNIAPRKRYRYSDVNFFLLQKVVEDVTNVSLDNFVKDNFYNSLGLRHLLYNPTDKFDKNDIVPTERDQVWRKGLVHGFVHDPSAALMGGVGGNAGIFANAEDIAVLFQMLANEGVYGGIQYFDAKTIQAFTSAKYGNHRGLGFDKPVNRKNATYSPLAPPSTYGHNGFTGTCVWVDPENDLVYVFLSNRIHPSSNNMKIFVDNVRGRIHDVVYDAFGSFDPTLPTLEDK